MSALDLYYVRTKLSLYFSCTKETLSLSLLCIYYSVSVLNKLISLALNLTRVTHPYQVVTWRRHSSNLWRKTDSGGQAHPDSKPKVVWTSNRRPNLFLPKTHCHQFKTCRLPSVVRSFFCLWKTSSFAPRGKIWSPEDLYFLCTSQISRIVKHL